jgi:hypothetical protein
MKLILFSTEMVRALLAGNKTQTRRLCKVHIPDNVTVVSTLDGHFVMRENKPGYPILPNQIITPKYNVGDELYVREGFCIKNGECLYKADYDDDTAIKWKPSIHQPKIHARIKLKVTWVRLERLHAITLEDIAAEGVSTENEDVDWKALWIKIHGLDSWQQNPYVFVYEFLINNL